MSFDPSLSSPPAVAHAGPRRGDGGVVNSDRLTHRHLAVGRTRSCRFPWADGYARGCGVRHLNEPPWVLCQLIERPAYTAAAIMPETPLASMVLARSQSASPSRCVATAGAVSNPSQSRTPYFAT